jgi:hypothetical protein
VSDHRIVGVHVTDRAQNAGQVQEVLGRHARLIRTRLGLHEVRESVASPHALILLETLGCEADIDALSDELRRLPGVQVQSMFFSHPKS